MKRFFVLLIFACVQAEDLGITRHIQPCLAQSVERILFDESLGQKFDCSSLPSEMQSVLALQMTFCHLNSTGIDPTSICSLPTLDDRRSDCLKNISRNPFAYLTYTNFLPHVQSLCYAMETQRWHHHARDTASHLHRHSNQIENEARNLLVEQETIQSNLDQTLLINQNAVDDALSVDRFLQVAQSDVDDLRGHLYVKDKAQIELIHQVNRLALLRRWLFFSDIDPRNPVQYSVYSLHRCIWFKFVYFLCSVITRYSSTHHPWTNKWFKVKISPPATWLDSPC